MKWSIELAVDVQRQFRKFDPQVVRRLRSALRVIATLDDPRSKGKPLTGTLRGLWRYRVGDYRIICDIRDAELIIVAVAVGHRRDVYAD